MYEKKMMLFWFKPRSNIWSLGSRSSGIQLMTRRWIESWYRAPKLSSLTWWAMSEKLRERKEIGFRICCRRFADIENESQFHTISIRLPDKKKKAGSPESIPTLGKTGFAYSKYKNFPPLKKLWLNTAKLMMGRPILWGGTSIQRNDCQRFY